MAETPGVAALLFDLDMTLVETWQDIVASTNAVRLQLGFEPLPRETLKGFIGDGVEKLVERAMADAMPPVHLDDAVARFREHYGVHCLDESRPYDGIPELLESFADMPKAVVSNKIERFCRQVLAGVGLDRHFAIVLGGDSVGALKPDPKPVLEAAKRVGAPIERCVMIGDTLRDVMAGRNAGCRTIAVTYGLVPRPILASAHPDALADTPGEIADRISRWT